MTPDFEALADRFYKPGTRALVLTGSFARGEAGPHSDVDLLRLVEAGADTTDDGSYLVDGWLTVLSSASPEAVTRWFSEPFEASNLIAGLRRARALRDPAGVFAGVQARTHAFVWDEAMQVRADRWAGERMVSWIEEVHKGLNGLERHDVGRLLNARFGLSWGLSRVMQVQRGVLTTGDNGFYDEVAQVMGLESPWVQLRREAFGVESDGGEVLTLRVQVEAGLRLYALTAELLAGVLEPPHQPLVKETVARIWSVLEP